MNIKIRNILLWMFRIPNKNNKKLQQKIETLFLIIN